MFLHYLLNRGEDEIISKVMNAQSESPTKNDWFSQVMKDLTDFGMDYLEMNEIKVMSKINFKNILKAKCKDASLKYLVEGNEEKSKILPTRNSTIPKNQ